MIEVQQRVETAGTPERVFALLSDVGRIPEWQPNVVSVTKIGDGPVGANTEFEQSWRFFGRQRRVPSRVTAWKEGELLAVSGDAGFVDFYCGFELTPLPDGRTRLTSRAEFRMRGVWKLAQPILARELRREMAEELASFQRLVEAERPVREAHPAAH